MTDPLSPNRHPHERTVEDLGLQAQPVPTTGSQQARATHALHLLATWAVRAARAGGEGQVLLDCIAPQSHECTPNPSPGEEMT